MIKIYFALVVNGLAGSAGLQCASGFCVSRSRLMKRRTQARRLIGDGLLDVTTGGAILNLAASVRTDRSGAVSVNLRECDPDSERGYWRCVQPRTLPIGREQRELPGKRRQRRSKSKVARN